MHFDFLRKVFLTHLHTDHWGDLPGLWAGGWIAGRTDALEVWGPSGAREDMGTKYAVEHFLKAYNWDNMTRLANLNSPGNGPAMSAIVSVMEINHVKKGIAMKQKSTRCAGPTGEGKHKWARAPVRATNYPDKSFIRRILMTASLVLVLSLVAAPVMSADGIDAEADKILRSMTTYLGGLPSISVRADVDNEMGEFILKGNQ